jgi:hypothetical protein
MQKNRPVVSVIDFSYRFFTGNRDGAGRSPTDCPPTSSLGSPSDRPSVMPFGEYCTDRDTLAEKKALAFKPHTHGVSFEIICKRYSH